MSEKIEEKRNKRLNEAIERLRALGIADKTEEQLKKGEIMMLLDDGSCNFVPLDKMAKMAIEKASKRKVFPYHVVKFEDDDRLIYLVLYVSFKESEWEDERSEDGTFVPCYCYDANDPDECEWTDMDYIKEDDGTITIE